MSTLGSALILDRDGTIIGMVRTPDGKLDSPFFPRQIELYPGLGRLLAPWVRAQVPIFIVTNQPGIAKGNFSYNDLAACHAFLTKALAEEGIPIAGIFTCVHHPVGTPRGDQSLICDCACRKPKPGLLHDLSRAHGIDLTQAAMLGDSDVDTRAAKAAGIARAIRVRAYVAGESDGVLAGGDTLPALEQGLAEIHRLPLHLVPS